MSHHVTVNVSPARFAENIHYLRKMVSPAKVCVVMKSDAYGHGLNYLAPVAANAGADYIGICSNNEARIVRQQLPGIPLIRLRSALPDEYKESVQSLNIEEQVGSLAVAKYLDELGRQGDKPLAVHLKIDTGMGRSGFFPDEVENIKHVCRLSGLKIVGIMTHLANADSHDLTEAQRQLDAFWALRHKLDEYLPDNIMAHTHNSAATIRIGERRADLVRVGAACFGVRTSSDFDNPVELQPVMSMKTQVMEVRTVPAGATIGYGGLYRTTRKSRIATIPIGFGEGYPRSLFNKGIVLIKGQRCPVIGRVSLNVTTIDITDFDGDIGWSEEVVLIGKQGDDAITFEELADKFDSVHTEINLMAGHMNERSYRD